MSEVKFPKSVALNNRRLFKRSEIEHYKQALFALANGEPIPLYIAPEVETLVNSVDAARELGFSQSTMSRRIKDGG